MLLPAFVLLVSVAAARGYAERLRWPVLFVGLAAVALPGQHTWWCIPMAAIGALTLRWRFADCSIGLTRGAIRRTCASRARFTSTPGANLPSMSATGAFSPRCARNS